MQDQCVRQDNHPNQASKSGVTRPEAAKQAKEQVVGSKQEENRHKYRQLKLRQEAGELLLLA